MINNICKKDTGSAPISPANTMLTRCRRQQQIASYFGWLTRSLKRLRIFTFHSIGDPRIYGIDSIGPEVFESFLAYLRDNGYRTYRVSDLAHHWPEILQEQRAVALTFDDGYVNHRLTVATLLRQYAMTGTFFIPTQFIGNIRQRHTFQQYFGPFDTEFLSWSDVREMIAEGFEIGSHGLNHLSIGELDAQTAREEIFHSKRILEEQLVTEIVSFAYPYGRGSAYAPFTTQLVREAGYASGCTMMGYPITDKSSLFELPRIDVNEYDSLHSFKLKLFGHYDLLRMIRRR